MRKLSSLVLGTLLLIGSGAIYAQQTSPKGNIPATGYSATTGSPAAAAEFFWPGTVQNNGDLTGLRDVNDTAECKPGTFECGSTCCNNNVVCCQAREQAASYCAPNGTDCPW